MAAERGRGVEGLASCAQWTFIGSHVPVGVGVACGGEATCLRVEWCAPGDMHTRDREGAIANVGLIMVVWRCVVCTMCVVVG